MTAEEQRTRLIGEIARVLRDGPVPDEARSAALTLIGWLARRMPGEPVSICDLTRCTGRHGALSHGPGREADPAHVPGLDEGHPISEWSRADDPPVSTVNGRGPDLPARAGASEAPMTRRSRSAR